MNDVDNVNKAGRFRRHPATQVPPGRGEAGADDGDRRATGVGDRGLERHGGKVSRVLYYKLVTDKATRYVLIYVTADGLITDEDVVDD